VRAGIEPGAWKCHSELTPFLPHFFLARTLGHSFSDFSAWLDELPDRRQPDRTVSSPRFLLWTALMFFLCKPVVVA
jgi:hypothetical protein